MKGVVLKKSDASVPKTIRVEYGHGPGDAIVRKGSALPLTVHTAGRTEPASLTAELKERGTGNVVSSVTVDLPVGAEPAKTVANLPCGQAGGFELSYRIGETPVATIDLKPLKVWVIDAAPAPRANTELSKTLVQQIDCAAQEPDFVSGGATQVVSKPFGSYRLSGDVGFLHAQHNNVAESWFAYKIDGLQPGTPHILEFDYPDDDYRTFLVALRESSVDAYPLAGGADSGGCWSLTNQMQTQSYLFWPRTDNARVAFLACHHGRRAAAAKIRIHRVADAAIPPMDLPVEGGRTFVNYYEEGSNFVGFYGGSKSSVAQYLKAAEMWPRELCHMGGNMLLPTVSVYQMNLYPSRYNNSFADMTNLDIIRMLLLNCERFGVTLAAEFHPEARELARPLTGQPAGAVRDNTLVSREGKTAGDGTPRHHPLHPRNQEWYIGMLGEIADRYKDSAAFTGVSLRAMSWANPALNNFHSLDWGYDDLTIGLFEKETGTTIPDVTADDPGRFAKRHKWLMANAKDRWIDWRCDKIAELYRKIVTRVRQARPDLRVYTTVFDLGKEAGLDADKISAIEGCALINCKAGYGRRAFTYEGYLADQKHRDLLLDPQTLNSTRGGKKQGPAEFMFGAGYFEATEKVLKPVEIGLPATTKPTWLSGVVNPAGRHYLERYAIALAETDALMLGDGGNAYTLGQPLLREFMNEFRRLPAVQFTPRTDARDPVAVWEKEVSGVSVQVSEKSQTPSPLSSPETRNLKPEYFFYAVNREHYPVKVAIEIEKPGFLKKMFGSREPIIRLSTGESAVLVDNTLSLELKPYQLFAFKTRKDAKIAKVTTTVPEVDRVFVTSQVDALGTLLDEVSAGKTKLDDAGKELLAKTVKEARQCLAEGRLWRARTLLENHELAAKVYNKTLFVPVGMEYLKNTPRAR